MNKFGLSDETIKKLTDYFSSKEEIEKVLIFGSRAKGNYSNGSDIDFAIFTDKSSVSGIIAQLDELPTPYKFDVINYKTLTHKGLKSSIDNDGILFYEKSR